MPLQVKCYIRLSHCRTRCLVVDRHVRSADLLWHCVSSFAQRRRSSPLCSQHPCSLLLLLLQDSSRLVKRPAPSLESVFSCFGRQRGSSLAPGLCRARRNKLLMSGATCGVTLTKQSQKHRAHHELKKGGKQQQKTLNMDVKKQQWSVEDTACLLALQSSKETKTSLRERRTVRERIAFS